MFPISKYALASQIIYVPVNFHRLLISLTKTELTGPGTSNQKHGGPRIFNDIVK